MPFSIFCRADAFPAVSELVWLQYIECSRQESCSKEIDAVLVVDQSSQPLAVVFSCFVLMPQPDPTEVAKLCLSAAFFVVSIKVEEYAADRVFATEEPAIQFIGRCKKCSQEQMHRQVLALKRGFSVVYRMPTLS